MPTLQQSNFTTGGLLAILEGKVLSNFTSRNLLFIPIYPHFGGVRWWLSCPFCGGRSGKLYLPTPHGEFACRLCHDLTYESCLRSKDSDAFLRKVASEAGLSLRLVKELLG